MTDEFLAEIRVVAFGFAPRGWAFCNGQLLPIYQNSALFSLIGTTYGGDGMSTFALPDLRDAMPLHPGHGPDLSYRYLGEEGGTDTVTLVQSQIPAHTHALFAQNATGTVTNPAGAALATPRYGRVLEKSFASSSNAVSTVGITTAGANMPHNNLPPYLVLNYIISLQGSFPARG